MADEAATENKTVVSAIRRGLRRVFDFESSGRVLVYSAIVGVVAGLGAAFFFTSLQFVSDFALKGIEGYVPPELVAESNVDQTILAESMDSGATVPELSAETRRLQFSPPKNPWLVLLVPTIGGLLCGILVYTFAPEAEGHGTDGLVKAFHRLGGRIRTRVPFVKTFASILTIGTGGSAGREGPIAQIGAGFGSYLATRLQLSDQERRILLLAGAAGGIGAMFRAPLGGALFAVEVLYASTAIEFTAFVPCIISSVIAYSTFATIFGAEHELNVTSLAFEGPTELPFFLVFAVVCAAVGFFYVWFFYWLRDMFHKFRIPNFVKPAIGGVLLGGIAMFFPQVMSGGYGWIQEAINGNLAIGLMLALVLFKILATSCTISSGGSGGVFAPSLFVGAMLGGAYGKICYHLFGDIAPQPEAFVLVGMGGFFAGVAKVPLTALIMVSEMTGSYALLVPLMLVSVINVAVLSSRWSLYEEQVPSLIDSPAHLGDFVVDVLEDIKVSDLPSPMGCPVVIPEDLPLDQLLSIVAAGLDSYYPVVDYEQRLVGIITLADVRAALVQHHDLPKNLVLASDITRSYVVTVTPDDNLHTTLKRCTREQITEIPIVSSEDPGRVIRMLHRQEVLAAYDDRMSEIRGEKV